MVNGSRNDLPFEKGGFAFIWPDKRFNRILYKMLTLIARELECMGIIELKVYPIVFLRVEYSLAKLGKFSFPFIIDMAK